MSIRLRLVFLIAAAAVAAVVVSTAVAAVVIHEGKGAGKARLGQVDTVAAAYLGPHGPLQRDPNYGSRVVYWIDFGKRMGAGRYPCEMLSDASHRVFQLSFNTPAFRTAKGIAVGSREALLRARYPHLRLNHTTRFDHYVLGRRPFTDFWVLNSTQRVYQIVLRSK